MKFTNYVVGIVFILFAASSSAATLDSLADCSGALLFSAIPAQKALADAPPYAREKYAKQVQFYQQGMNNLESKASKLAGYSQSKYKATTNSMAMNLFNQAKSNSLSLDVLNQTISGCISEAGLYVSDYPR